MKINKVISDNYNIYNAKANNRQYHFKNAVSIDTVSFGNSTKTQKKSFIEKISDRIAGITNKFSKETNMLPLQNGTYYNSVYKGFEDHFYTLADSLITEIKLSKEQEALLIEKINAFEEYKSSLSQSDLEELEKNKHGMLDFACENGYPDNELKGYKEFLSKYDHFKKGDFSNITNEDLAQLLFYTDTSDLISDGKIGSFAQGRTGDCWFLSMLGNYAATVEGERNIADRISKPDKNGNYTIKLNNPLNQNEFEFYTVTKEELQNYDLNNSDSAFSSGDIDVRLFEIAIDKMLYKYLAQPESCILPKYSEVFSDFNEISTNNTYTPGETIAESTDEKIILVHKAMGYKNNIKHFYRNIEENDLKKYFGDENVKYNNQDIYIVETDLTSDADGKPLYTHRIEKCKENELSQIINSGIYKQSDFTVNTGSKKYSDNKKEQRYISTGHVYNLSAASNNTVTVIDPYNSAFPHTISMDKFDELYKAVVYIPKELIS